MINYDFDIYKGSTFSLNLTIKESGGSIIDLTDYNVSGYGKFKLSDSGKLVNLNVSKELPYSSGVVNLLINKTGTLELPIATTFYDIIILHTGNNTVTGVYQGKMYIHPQVTV